VAGVTSSNQPLGRLRARFGLHGGEIPAQTRCGNRASSCGRCISGHKLTVLRKSQPFPRAAQVLE